MSKTIVDFLRENGQFKGCFNGYEIILEPADNYIFVMEVSDGDKLNDKYMVPISRTIMYEIQDLLYDEYDIEIRFCSECGKPYDAGYMAGDGEWYYCEECFEDAMDKDYGKGKWRPTKEEGCRGGFYEYFDGNEWEDTGIFYTEWN